MSYTDRHIIETCLGLLQGLSSSNKAELIEALSQSLKTETSTEDAVFYESFGAFADDKSAEEICLSIKSSREFRTKDLIF